MAYMIVQNTSKPSRKVFSGVICMCSAPLRNVLKQQFSIVFVRLEGNGEKAVETR